MNISVREMIDQICKSLTQNIANTITTNTGGLCVCSRKCKKTCFVSSSSSSSCTTCCRRQTDTHAKSHSTIFFNMCVNVNKLHRVSLSRTQSHRRRFSRTLRRIIITINNRGWFSCARCLTQALHWWIACPIEMKWSVHSASNVYRSICCWTVAAFARRCCWCWCVCVRGCWWVCICRPTLLTTATTYSWQDASHKYTKHKHTHTYTDTRDANRERVRLKCIQIAPDDDDLILILCYRWCVPFDKCCFMTRRRQKKCTGATATAFVHGMQMSLYRPLSCMHNVHVSLFS